MASVEDPPLACAPTAAHALELTQDNPVRPLTNVPGSGLATTDHVAPVNDSIRVSDDAAPTARQSDESKQVTPLSVPPT